MSKNRSRVTLTTIAFLAVLSLAASACGSESDDGLQAATADESALDATESDEADDDAADQADAESPDSDANDEEADEPDTDSAEEPEEVLELSDSWRGVTAETIAVGISMLDFELLQSLNFSPNGWGDQQAIWQALIDNLNESGGINGRMIEAIYDFYNPIEATDADRACAALIEDNEIFAELGGFVGPLAGTADTCIVGLNETILVGGEMNNEELAKARAPWFHEGPPVEFQTINLLNLIVETGRADGARVFTMGGAAASAEEDFVVAELESRGIEVVGGALIEATDGDTLAQDQELAVAFERFGSTDANTLMIFGTPSASIRGAAAAGLTGEIAIWSNDSAGLANLGSTISDKSIANGTLSSTGPTDTEIWEDPTFQSECVEPVAARVPDTDFKDPATHEAGEENWFLPTRRYCLILSLFSQIATAAGADLTPTSFEDAAFSGAFADFSLPGTGPASLSPDKLGSRDSVRLSEYDASVGDGDLVPVTDLLDVFP